MFGEIRSHIEKTKQDYLQWKEDLVFEFQRKYVENFEDGLLMSNTERKEFIIRSIFQVVLMILVTILLILLVPFIMSFLRY